MIIANGYIQPKVKRQATPVIDPETGYPKKVAGASWGDPIPCQYYANSYNALAKAMGEPRTQRSYTILIEECNLDTEQVRLCDLACNEVGEFSIISATPLEAVGQIKLLV